MECLHCGVPLAILRSLSNGPFCCDEHRRLHEKAPEPPHIDAVPRHGEAVRLPGPAARRSRVGSEIIANLGPAPLLTRKAVRPALPPPTALFGVNWPPAGERLEWVPGEAAPRVQCGRSMEGRAAPLDLKIRPMIPGRKIELGRIEGAAALGMRAAAEPKREDDDAIDLSTQRLREIWRRTPGDLKLIAVVIPMILVLTLNAAGPRLYSAPMSLKASSGAALEGAVGRHWTAFRKSVAARATVDYAEDFHRGLDEWMLPGGAGKWGYDAMGFVRPGGLGLFRPTLKAQDCEVDFGGRIEQRGLGFVFRAADTSNYQAVRLVVTRPGPLPEVHAIRYTVIGGREGPKTEKPVPSLTATDRFFNVHVSVRGSDFTLMVEGKVVDFWADDRLKAGGVGFFCGKGESARIRRVEVTHQNDTLGRICAYIASEKSD